jgi:hypothetical protein
MGKKIAANSPVAVCASRGQPAPSLKLRWTGRQKIFFIFGSQLSNNTIICNKVKIDYLCITFLEIN